jgi:hypothetical protein
MDEKPVTKIAQAGEMHVGVREDRAVGRVEGPARVDAAGTMAPDRERGADHVEVPARAG